MKKPPLESKEKSIKGTKKMQAVILAAGRGSRLKPITDKIPKCLVEVCNTPFIINELESLSRHKEIEEVIIVVGYKKNLIKKRIGNEYKGMKIIYVDNDKWNRTNNIYSFWLAGDYIRKDFILMEADLFFEHKILDPMFENRGENIILLARHKPYMSGTVVEIDEKDKTIKKLISARNQDANFDYSDKYKTINIHSFNYSFFKNQLKPSLDFYTKTHMQIYWELILGVLIYLNTPGIYAHIIDDNIKWYEVDDENDLDVANYIFMDEQKRMKAVSNLHGGYWRYNFLDFCFLFNLYFPSERLYSTLKRELPRLIGAYPSAQHKIRRLLSVWYRDNGFDANNLIVGNGASELIRILNRHLIKKITIPVPTFNEFEDLESDQINQYVLDEKKDFILDPDAFIKSVKDSKSNFALIINPNNPTSVLTERQKIIKILESLKQLDGIIVDESFIDFSGDREKHSVQPLINKYPNLIILRSLSKEFGVPGLRLGYLASSNQDLKNKVKKYLPIWNINSIAERFLELFLAHREEYSQSINKIIEDRDDFYTKLKDINMLKVFKPYANFILCKIVGVDINSESLCAKLFKDYNIFIKDCSNKTALNDKFIRIAVRTKEDNKQVITALKDIENELKKNKLSKKNRLEKWRKVWERKGRQVKKKKLTLKDLIAIDGFDTATGTMTKDVWMKIVGMAKKELGLKRGDFLLEVGCGAGAMLLPLSKIGIKVAGIDYSSSLAKLAKKVIPNILIHVVEANRLPFKNDKFDAILSFSVFEYFPNYQYARKTLLEILRVSKNNAKILIADVPDIAKKKLSERYRQNSLPKERYNQLYSDHSHLYYSKKWFKDFAQKNGLRVKIFDKKIKGYDNSKFRFNVLIAKPH